MNNELLSPAGTITSFYAAISSGANAIYLGIKKFNARAYASNFSLEELKEFQGSKYSHSDVGNVYADIQDLLKQGETVLFTGTPCQCAALRKFLVKPYDNLLIVDLVCHGVPSRRVLRDSIRATEDCGIPHLQANSL